MGELEIGAGGLTEIGDALLDAIDLASDQDKATWLTANGKRIAAIVPVDVAERYAVDYGSLAS